MTVEAGTLDFTNGGTNPADYAGVVLRVGFSAAPNIPAGSVDDNSVAVTWGAWRVEGDDVDGADDTTDGAVCTIDGDGVVVANGAAASVGDTCTVFAVASADNYNDSAERALGTLTIAAEGDFAQLTLTAPTYTEDLVVRGYPVAIATEPTVSSEVEGLTWTYSAEGSRGGSPVENICSVNENDGTVTAGTDAVVGDVCAIVATADAPGYGAADATAVELSLHDTFTSLSWSAFPVDTTVGVDVNLSASSKRPTTTPTLVGTTYTISPVSGDCTYNGSDVLAFTDVTECVVKVVAFNVNAHYVDIEGYYRITPRLGTIAVNEGSLASYGAVKVGGGAVAAPSLSAVSTSGTNPSYTLAENSSGCTVDGDGAVTGTADGTDNCKIVMTLTKTGYNNYEYTYTISIGKGTWTAVAWGGGYSSALVDYNEAAPTVVLPTSTPTADSWLYSTTDTSVCTIRESDGLFTIVGAGTCTVKAVPVKEHYVTHAGVTTQVRVNMADQAGPDWTNSPYGNSPTLAVGAGSLSLQETEPTGQGEIFYKVASGDLAYCSVVKGTGDVTANPAGANQDCDILAWYAGNANYNSSPEVKIATIDIELGTLDTPTWGAFSGSLTVGGARATPSATTLAGATVGYTLKSSSAANCHLRSTSTGQVEAKVVANPAGKTCTVVAEVSKTGYTSLTKDISIPLAPGTIAGVTWSPTTDGTVGVELTLADVSGDADGDTVTYSKHSGAECRVTGQTGQTVIFTGTADCVVKATVERDGYTTLNIPKTITVAKGTLDLSWALSSTRVQISDSPVTLAAVTGTDASTADITYSVVSQGGTNCAFGSNAQDATSFHTLTFNAVGTCQVRATATQTHYNNWGPTDHDITVTSNTPVVINWSGYGTNNTVTMGGGDVEPNTPSFTPSSGTTGTYSHTGTGCRVNAAGTLTPLIADDSCVVTLTATTTDSSYDTGTTQFTVNVIKSDQSAPGLSDVYGSSPSLVTGGTLRVNAAPNGGHGTVTYKTTTADKCEVVTPGGGVIRALLNGPCTIQAKWGGDASYNPSGWGTVQTIQIGLGTLSITTPGSYTGPLVVGNAAGLTPSAPTTDPTGADLSYALKQGETDCTPDGTTGASHGKVIAANVAVTSGTTACTVVLTASKSGYNPATAELEVNLQGAALVFEIVAPPAYPYPGFATDGGIEVGGPAHY